MGCLRRVKRESDRYTYTVSQYTMLGDDEIDLFDKIAADEPDLLNNICRKSYDHEFWSRIGNMDTSTLKVIDHFLNGTKLTSRVEKKMEAIMSNLKHQLGKYRSVYCNTPIDDCIRFGKVYHNDDNISSAVVEMRDGTKAVYYGETIVGHNGDTKIVFYGPNCDYVVPLNIAKNLKVRDVEMY